MDGFTFTDMKKIRRNKLGSQVPLELFRAIRLIGMYQGLPMKGKSTTVTIGRKIGESLPVETAEDVLNVFKELKIGIPRIVKENEKGVHIAVEDCFCEGLPAQYGNMVCDLEGAMLEGALSKVWGRKLSIREIKCNVNGDEHCEYQITFL